MNEYEHAAKTSRTLDDGLGTLEDRFAPHARVHAALSEAQPPLSQPSLDIRSRVMLRVGGSRKTERGVWPLALAASLTMVAGIGWMIAHSSRPVQSTPQIASANAPQNSGFSVLLGPIAKSDAAVQASIEAPFIQEARFIGEDSRRGLDAVLSRLPITAGLSDK
jgi:hypothetical protein